MAQPDDGGLHHGVVAVADRPDDLPDVAPRARTARPRRHPHARGADRGRISGDAVGRGRCSLHLVPRPPPPHQRKACASHRRTRSPDLTGRPRRPQFAERSVQRYPLQLPAGHADALPRQYSCRLPWNLLATTRQQARQIVQAIPEAQQRGVATASRPSVAVLGCPTRLPSLSSEFRITALN
jgi:hypothetical protein